MSPKNSILTVGLTALGLFGYAATRAAYSGAPVPPSGPVPVAAPASPETPSVLLLTNGRLLQGPITRDQDHYVISQNGGEIRFHKDQVEDVFTSVVDVYKYKLAQIPVNDPDEHMKLARWCLGQNLTAEARTELKSVLTVSPSSNDAKLMLSSINASEARAAARPRVDPGLVQTRAEMPDGLDRSAARPAEIDANVLRRASKEFGGVGLPVIFDLPPGIAVKRAQQFTNVVHTVLQDSCAKCHNEKYEGNFQLVQVKRRRDLSADVIRANLDATLKLIDPENPGRSELLSSTLLPHGLSQKPIFRGSNDPRFQIISAWANSLRSSRLSTDGTAQVQNGLGGTREPNVRSTGFATDRSATPDASQAGDGMPKPFVEFKQPPPRVIPPARFVKGQGMVAEETPPSPDEFPVTNMLGGQIPKLKSTPSAPVPVAKDDAPKPTAAPTPMPGETLPDLPPVPSQTPSAAARVEKAKSAKSAKPVKIDQSVLERMLQNRNSGR